MSAEKTQQPCIPLEENLKKALTELLVLHLLSQRDYFIGELTEVLKQKSNGVLKLVFPYSAVYRLQEEGCIIEGDKRIAPDGRKRQFYSISPLGRDYYQQLLASYQRFIGGVDMVLNEDSSHQKNHK